MNPPNDAANGDVSSMVVAGTLDELWSGLLSRVGWVERRMPVHGTVCEGFVYLERRRHGFVVWMADREDAESMDPPAVRVDAFAHPRGVRLELRSVRTRRTRATQGLAIVTTAVLGIGVIATLGLGVAFGVPWTAVPVTSLAVVVLGSMASERGGRAKSSAAWGALIEAVTPGRESPR